MATDGYSYELPSGEWQELRGADLEHAGEALLGTASGQKPEQRISLSSAAVLNDETNGFKTSVNVTREPLPAGTTLADYIRASVQNLGNVVQDPQLVGTPVRTKLGGSPAGTLHYTGIQAGRRVEFADITTIRNGVAYNFTFTALPQRFEAAGSDFKSMIDSWQWSE